VTGGEAAEAVHAGLPRLLTIMGSGETAPTMAKVHRQVVEQLDAASLRVDGPVGGAGQGTGGSRRERAQGLLLDTPFGFQTNATEIGVRAVNYFRESVGANLEVAGLRSASDLQGENGERIVNLIAQVPLVFAGPGSPSYALRNWRGTLVPSLLNEKLILGGAVTFASAAALTLGVAAVPVYEIYKVGEEPHWLEALDLLRPLGLPVVIIPHYDNAEGQTHDTRYCYLGEERLSQMEKELDEKTFILGVDEHTALCMDLGRWTGSVVGRGGVTVRVRGQSFRIEAGEEQSLDRLLEIATTLISGPAAHVLGRAESERGVANPEEAVAGPETTTPEQTTDTSFVPSRVEGSPLLQAIRQHEVEFRAARERFDADGMVSSVLALEEEMWAWRADTLQSDEMDRGRASLRSMIGELGDLSLKGTRDPAELVGPYVNLALSIRDNARREERFEDADSVRERLELLGVAVHDTPDGSTWELRDSDG
jgi:hypothetical protein